MATARASTAHFLLILLATLLCAAAAASSWDGREPWRCERRCEDRPRHQRARCVQECREEQERGGHELGRRGEGSGDERESESEQEQESRRPYVFDRRSFRHVVRSEQGSVRALRPFHEASKLLRGIRDYRVAVLEANPRSFIVPSHTDAHCIGYVAQGRSTIDRVLRLHRVLDRSLWLACRRGCGGDDRERREAVVHRQGR